MEPLSRAFALPPPFISGYVQPLPPRGQLGSVGHIHHSAVSGGCCGIGCDIAVACDLATAQYLVTGRRQCTEPLYASEHGYEQQKPVRPQGPKAAAVAYTVH